MFKHFLVIVTLLFCSFTCLLANVNAGDGDSIKLKGKVFHANKKVKDARMVIYIGNKKYKELQLKSANSIKTLVPVNAVLTIEMEAPKYFLKRFIIDTRLPQGKENHLKYKFDMDLFAEEELAGVNTSILDFPIGLVSFHNGEFIHDEKYTNQMKMESFRLLEDAKLANRNNFKKSK